MFKVEDDGPKVATELTPAEAVTLDKFLATADSPFSGPAGSGSDGIKSATLVLADNFGTPTYGADGAGSTAYKLVLNGDDVPSGLYATDPDIDGGKGEQIVLNQSGNVITGSTPRRTTPPALLLVTVMMRGWAVAPTSAAARELERELPTTNIPAQTIEKRG